MVRMHLHVLPMSVTCVLARASDVLDVCVPQRHRCASVAAVMSSAVQCVGRVDALADAVMRPQCSHGDS